MIYLHALMCMNLTQASSVLLAHLVQLTWCRCSVDHCDVLLGIKVKWTVGWRSSMVLGQT